MYIVSYQLGKYFSPSKSMNSRFAYFLILLIFVGKGDILGGASDVSEVRVRYLKSHCLLRQRTAVHIISLQPDV